MIKQLLCLSFFFTIATVKTTNASWWDTFFQSPEIGTIDVAQDNDNIVVTMNIPTGIEPENIDITIQGQTLCVSGSSQVRAEVKEEDFYKKEMSSSKFNRCTSLPCDVDDSQVAAELNGNVLVITMRKIKEENRLTKKIKVVRV